MSDESKTPAQSRGQHLAKLKDDLIAEARARWCPCDDGACPWNNKPGQILRAIDVVEALPKGIQVNHGKRAKALYAMIKKIYAECEFSTFGKLFFIKELCNHAIAEDRRRCAGEKDAESDS